MNAITRFALLASTTAAAIFAPAFAQTVPDNNVQEVALEIPAGQTLFKPNNPNVRKATAIVNGEIITGTDVDHRVAMILAANDAPVPADQLEQLRQQILVSLIDETLQMQEAEVNEIKVTDSEVDNYFKEISQQNFKLSPKDTEKFLLSKNSSVATLKRQIKAEIAWNRVLGRNVRPKINVSDKEVAVYLDRQKANKGQTEYRLGEIYLSATPANQEQVYATAKKILEQIRAGGNFATFARQFSEASTASTGGDLGWVKISQLPESLGQAAVEMGTNEIVAVPSPGGISLLLMIDRRQIAVSDPRDSILSLKQLAVTFPKGMTEAQAAPLVKRFSEETQKIRGCGAADDVAKTLNAEVVNRDGLKIRDLPGPLQEVMLSLQIGQSTPPYGSLDEGVRVFVMCGRDTPEALAEESFDDVMQRLEAERTNKRARMYMRDLRRDAIIEYN